MRCAGLRAGRPGAVAVQHQPRYSGVLYMDAMRTNGEAEQDVIARMRRPDYMFWVICTANRRNLASFHIQRSLIHPGRVDPETEEPHSGRRKRRNCASSTTTCHPQCAFLNKDQPFRADAKAEVAPQLVEVRLKTESL